MITPNTKPVVWVTKSQIRLPVKLEKSDIKIQKIGVVWPKKYKH